MSGASPDARQRDESPSAVSSLDGDNPSMFQFLFERSADAIWLFDPRAGVFVNWNAAAVELAYFEGTSQGITLHDENQILEVDPAALRILDRQSQQELLGKHRNGTSPPFQPNDECSALLARNHIQECMTNGSARFEWMSRTPQGVEVPLEVALTRIQWSGLWTEP